MVHFEIFEMDNIFHSGYTRQIFRIFQFSKGGKMTEDKNFLERLENLTLVTKGRLDRTTHCPAIRNIRQEFLKNTDDLLAQMAQWARSETETLLQQINQENAQEVTETIHAIIVMERTFLYRFMEARMSVHDLMDNMLIQISCTPRKHG